MVLVNILEILSNLNTSNFIKRSLKRYIHYLSLFYHRYK